ncbi:MAG: 2'-5' RNA ligase family protein [Pirellulales bacterium]
MDANKPHATTMFIGLDPDPLLADLVWEYKRRARELVGPQTFLDHPPHLTVYLAAFDDDVAVLDATQRLAATTTLPSLDIVGWHVFAADGLTGGNTLVCQIADADVRSLRALQLRAIERIAPLRNESATGARYASRLPTLSEIETAAIRRCGFPFVGEHWCPHVTIASFRQFDWPTIERELLADPPQVHAMCQALTLYRLVDGHPTPVRSFAFGRARPATIHVHPIAS